MIESAQRRASAARERAIIWNISAAQRRTSEARRRASTARERVITEKGSAAQRRAIEAEARLLSAAQKGVKWKILRFLSQPSVAAWGALFYIVISSIGITYSGAFYFRFDDIHIFDFFDTPDFLLSVFQDIKTLTIGLVATLGGIGIIIYRAYNSGIYRAYTGYRDKQEARVQWEANILIAIALVTIALAMVALVTIFFVSFRWDKWFLIKMVLYLLSVSPLIIFAYCLIKRADNPTNGDKPETRLSWGVSIWVAIALAAIFSISFWEDKLFLINTVLYLLSVSPLIVFAYCLIKRADNPTIRDKQEARANWKAGTLVSIVLVEGIVLLPFLSGVTDSKAALEEKESRRPVKVTLRRGTSEAGILPPDRTLLLGTTSSFHIFYECEKTLKAGDCKNGRPFIIPTANIASLEFIPARKPSEGIAKAIDELDTIISGLKSEKITVTKAISQLNEIITSINKSGETHTKLIIPKIENPKTESVAHPGPDKIATAGVTLQSYLKGETRITHLNETITTLNETIKNLADTPDSDLAKIAKAIENLNLPGVQNPCTSSLKEVMTVEPFLEAKHDQLEKNTRKDLSQLFGKMRDHFKNYPVPQHLILIGRVDVRPLSSRSRQFYGPQIKLARARAKWVQGELLKEFPAQIDLDRTLLLSAGPLHVGQEVSDDDWAKDRAVEVWACWNPKEFEPASSSTDSAE